MTMDELKGDLRAILMEETHEPVDWRRVQALCRRTLGRLAAEPHPLYPHDVIFHFLDDADERREDDAYASAQRQRLQTWLSTTAD